MYITLKFRGYEGIFPYLIGSSSPIEKKKPFIDTQIFFFFFNELKNFIPRKEDYNTPGKLASTLRTSLKKETLHQYSIRFSL